MISKTDIQSIYDRMSIEEVVSPVVSLEKRGSNLFGLCPFHQEKTPSFSVHPGKGIYKCFGCGRSGNTVGFVMEYHHKSFPEAIHHLAGMYNIRIQEVESQQDDEAIRIQEQFMNLNEWASTWFQQQLQKSMAAFQKGSGPLDYAESRMSKDEIIQFRIGYAPDSWDGFFKAAREAGYLEEFLLKSTLVKQSEKNNKVYDYFRDRIIFPIFNRTGRVIAFGGRTFKTVSDQVKYLNSPDTPVYHKSQVLYGLNFAWKAIQEKDCCHIVEGYTDVIRLHSLDLINTVAPCGTALTSEQLTVIRRFTKNVILIFDGDSAGRKAVIRNGELCLSMGMNVKVFSLEEGQDPFDYFNSQTVESISKNKQDYLFLRSSQLFEKAADDPMVKHEAVNEISRLLSLLNESTLQAFYIEQISKRCSVNRKLFQEKLDEIVTQADAEGGDDEVDIPEGVDVKEYEKWGFYSYNNEYYFRTRDGIRKFSNFIMRPLFHVESINDTKRIYELINYKGYRCVIDFDMMEMTSLGSFRKNIEGRGNFLFWGTDSHMNKLKLKLYEQTRTCLEIRNLGWQNEGFWAWANGITNSNGFQAVDENGIVEHNSKYFYIPAFSKIYIDDRSVFIDERKFSYKSREIPMRQWAEKFMAVFEDNAIISIAFWLAGMHRDFILHIFKNFPILNLFGPKGSGKSQLAMSLSCLFGSGQTPFNIHNGTKPGLAEHIQQFINALAWVDEYKNNLDYDKVETLKSIYDAIGRSRLNMDKGKKKETTLVNSAVILSGQEMPTADVALFSRVIFLQFKKTEFSREEKQSYDELKAMENEGLSHLSAQVIAHREYFEKHYYSTYEDVLGDVYTRLEKSNIEDRILRSMCTILAAFKVLENKLDLPFTFDELKEVGIRSVRDQNNQISKSNELAIFWEIIEALFDENILIDRWHFKIDWCDELNLVDIKRTMEPAIEVLKLKFSSIYKLYAEHARKTGQTVLPNTTLKYYLENAKYYIGVERSSKFIYKEYDREAGEMKEHIQVTTAYCFDYVKIGINLTRIIEGKMDIMMKVVKPDLFHEPAEKLPF
jgi:DNA primase catalytic core